MIENKILLMDCFEFMKSQSEKVFDVSFTSPPYNRVRNDTYKHFDDIDKKYYNTLVTLTSELLRLTKKDVIINVQQNMCNKEDFFKWLGAFSKNIKGVVIWTKTNPQPATNYRKKDDSYSITNAFEYFIVFNENNKEFRANNKMKNVISTPVNSEHFQGHGAVMRYDVAEHFIKNFTKENDLVFDPFMGMGTTALACMRNNRKYLGTEIVPEYRDGCMNRIKQEYSLF